jgi:nucleoside 2-deoxyribosyltransferase
MNIFVAASYSSQVNYETGEVFSAYKTSLENTLSSIEEFGYTVFCALRADNYQINNANPAKAFSLDIERIKAADTLLAILDEKVSAGVQTEIGYALALNKTVILAHPQSVELAWFNKAIVLAGQAKEITLPLTVDSF